MIRARPEIVISIVVVSGLTVTRAAHAAEAEPSEATQESAEDERELFNGVTLGGAYTFHFLRDRENAETGRPLGTREHLGGFVISYDRELIPGRLGLTIAKPFYFNKERFDTPFDFILKGLLRKGDWEGFLGLALTWNIRIFEKEREAKEGERNVLSLGVGAVMGGAYFFNPRWSLDLEIGYAYIPTEDIVEHELSAALSGAYHF